MSRRSGVPPGMTSTYYKAICAACRFAYSPNFTSGFLGKVFGSNGKTSIRTGWGLFYNPMEQLVLEQFGAEPPFGSSPSFFNTFFNTPFVGQAGSVAPNGFNGILTPPKGKDPGWANYSSHPSLRRLPAPPAHAIHRAIQLHHPARACQGPPLADQLCRITGTSVAGFARHQRRRTRKLAST